MAEAAAGWAGMDRRAAVAADSSPTALLVAMATAAVSAAHLGVAVVVAAALTAAVAAVAWVV
jgi:hypothetical protein